MIERSQNVIFSWQNLYKYDKGPEKSGPLSYLCGIMYLEEQVALVFNITF